MIIGQTYIKLGIKIYPIHLDSLKFIFVNNQEKTCFIEKKF